MKLGIDLSQLDVLKGQLECPIDAQLATKRGLSWATLRVTYGRKGYDVYHPEATAQLSAAGWKLYDYHWYDPKEKTPEFQAENFLSRPRYGYPMLDLEEGTVAKFYAGIGDDARKWLEYVRKVTGLPPALYMNYSAYKFAFWDYRNPYRYDWLIEYPLIFAQWDVPPNRMPSGPNIPLPWTPYGWLGWQYTEKGSGAWYGMKWAKECSLQYLNV